MMNWVGHNQNILSHRLWGAFRSNLVSVLAPAAILAGANAGAASTLNTAAASASLTPFGPFAYFIHASD